MIRTGLVVLYGFNQFLAMFHPQTLTDDILMIVFLLFVWWMGCLTTSQTSSCQGITLDRLFNLLETEPRDAPLRCEPFQTCRVRAKADGHLRHI